MAVISHPGCPLTAREAGLRAWLWRGYSMPHAPFTVVTRDGVHVCGVHLNRDHSTLLIYCHGFLSGKNFLHIQRWVDLLAQDVDVIAFDFRGHGESGGASTLSDSEVLDLEAVVQYAQRFGYQHIVLMGSSMGGAVVIRYAANAPAVNGVVTMGAFANQQFSPMAMRGLDLLKIPFGRTVMHRVYATRIERTRPQYAPRDFVSEISPRPLLVIHGEYDPLIPVAHARELFDHAREPKQLYIIPRGLHDTENLNPRTKQRILKWLQETAR